MRARMSDATLTEMGRAYYRAACHQGASAEIISEREARSILAETEPMSGDAASTWRQTTAHAPLWALRSNDTGCALAESLRSFVEGN